MKSWKTSLFGFLSIGLFVAAYFMPQHKQFFTDLLPVIVAAGLFSSKDNNVTGGTKEQ